MRAENQRVIEEFRANGRRTPPGEEPLVLLTTVGRRSGRRHTTPMAVQRDGERLVVAASMGGNPTNPQWYENLAVNPDVTVEHDGEEYEARASTVPPGPERDRLFARMNEVIPGLHRYQERAQATRLIPIVVLERR